MDFYRLPHTLKHALSDMLPHGVADMFKSANTMREIPHDEDHPIWQEVNKAAAELAYNAPSHVFVIRSNVANAFGDRDGQVIGLSQGLIEALDRDALRAVIRHELRHLNQPQLTLLEQLEEKAQASYDHTKIPHETMLPYTWAHSVLMAIQNLEDEAIIAEAAHGDRADDALRSLLKTLRWNTLLPVHTVGDVITMEGNPYQSLYERLIRPQAARFFEDRADLIALAQRASWPQFVAEAAPFYLCAVVDVIEEVMETGKLRPRGEWHSESPISHPTHAERYQIHQGWHNQQQSR